MKCLICTQELTEAFFIRQSLSNQFKGGRFACPHCGAEHVRRTVGQLESGEPIYTVRLWGHPAIMKPRAPLAEEEGGERRRVQRVISRR